MITPMVDNRVPMLRPYENPNTNSQIVNRHNQPQQNATGPSLATAAVPDHPGATPPLVPAPPVARALASAVAVEYVDAPARGHSACTR